MILAIETSGNVASAALTSEDKLVAEFTINNKLTHSQTIMPMIDQMLKMAEVPLLEVSAIAVSSGPGSFTGLRIGAATAKGLAHGLNLEIVSVPTLDGIAYNVCRANDLICPIMDARRGQVYTAVYENTEGALMRLTEYMATDIEEIISMVCAYCGEKNKRAIFLGDGVNVYGSQIKQIADFSVADLHLSQQKASSVGFVAGKLLKEGKSMTYYDFAPFYLRRSQAEQMERKAGHGM